MLRLLEDEILLPPKPGLKRGAEQEFEDVSIDSLRVPRGQNLIYALFIKKYPEKREEDRKRSHGVQGCRHH